VRNTNPQNRRSTLDGLTYHNTSNTTTPQQQRRTASTSVNGIISKYNHSETLSYNIRINMADDAQLLGECKNYNN